MNQSENNYRELKEYALSLGFSLFGVADVQDQRDNFLELNSSVIGTLDKGIALAVRLSDAVLEDIGDHPTRLYLHHYRQANYFLDRGAFQLASFIQDRGGKALAVAASQLLDWDKQKAHLSHKEISRRAGLGWIGRNNLLVTPEWGSRVRLVTVLTDLPLRHDRPLERDCGECRKCLDICPAGAIKEKPEDFDHIKCYEKLRFFRNKLNLGQYICGVCVKACQPPFK